MKTADEFVVTNVFHKQKSREFLFLELFVGLGEINVVKTLSYDAI